MWGRVLLNVPVPATLRAVLDALETRYPMLRGTIREYGTGQRRAFLRYFACEEDWSLESPDKPLPEGVVSGKEPLLILGAIAGGGKRQWSENSGQWSVIGPYCAIGNPAPPIPLLGLSGLFSGTCTSHLLR